MMAIETSSECGCGFVSDERHVSNITPSDFFTNGSRVPRDIQLVSVFASGVEKELNDNT
jgi:hypothetical protein